MINSGNMVSGISEQMNQAVAAELQKTDWNKAVFAADDTFVLASDGSLKFDWNSPEELTRGIVLSEILPRRRCPLNRFSKGK